MTAIQTSASTPATKAAPAPPRHRFWIPVVILFLAACLLATPFVLAELEKYPEKIQYIAMYAEMTGVPGSAGLILLWWLFLSGFSWRARLGAVVLLAAAVTGFVASIREWELVMFHHFYLRPKFTFVWEKTTDQNRAAYEGSLGKIDLAPISLAVQPSDYPRYCGRDGDGIAYSPTLARDWSAATPRVLYKRPCDRGYSSFAVVGNVAITLEQRTNRGLVVCYDRDTGRERWTYDQLGVWKDANKMGDGPRTTPTIDDKGRVFALGASGLLVCLDGATGKEQWKVNILEDSESKAPTWGLAGSPLIVENLVVVNPGVDPNNPAGRAVCAYDRETGKRVWAAGNHPAGYSSPRLAMLGGMRQILLFDGDGLAGIDPANGKELWRYGWPTMMNMNNVQPLVHGDDRVFISSELIDGCAMVRVKKGSDGWTVQEEWKHKRFWAKFSNPVVVGVAIYGLSGGDLYSLDVETGERFWKERGHGRFGQGQLVAAGDKLIVQSDDGKIFLVAAETTAYKELGSFQVFDGRPKTWNAPALAGTQLFIRDNEKEMACVELPAGR